MQDHRWLVAQTAKITTSLPSVKPSQLAEQYRYLPASVTSMPGFYRFALAPYLREPLDCLATTSPVREVAIQKGAQVGCTVGILENALFYVIVHSGGPVLLLTSDQELAQARLEVNVLPMLQHSGFMGRIKSTEEGNRKTGKTNRKLEWVNGYCLPVGSRNPNKLRSVSIEWLFCDEIDSYGDFQKDGDTLGLAVSRTAAYEHSRKILYLSTPLLKDTSKIATQFERGDRRFYFCHCLRCGHAQVLRWKHVDPGTGAARGLTWEMSGPSLIAGSVRYLCESCGHGHSNDDKPRMMEHAEWRPTAKASSPHVRSYHLSALYSLMQTWDALVMMWLDCWDPVANRCKSSAKLRVFYNNVLGEPFEERGKNLVLSKVAEHRRESYCFSEIPNNWAREHCSGPVLLLTCAVDVHADNLAVAVFGWTRGRRAILVDYWTWEGDPEQLDDPGTWGRLAQLIETPERYVADDGKSYHIGVTFVDSGYLATQAYQFTSQFEGSVYPVKGRDTPIKNATIKEFSEFKTKVGSVGVTVTVDLYKERWQAALARNWDGEGVQPPGHFNCPRDTTDRQLKQLTVESRRRRTCATTGRNLGHYWHRGQGARNELWDTLVYASSALDYVAWTIAIQQMEQETLVWDDFWNFIEREKLFFND